MLPIAPPVLQAGGAEMMFILVFFLIFVVIGLVWIGVSYWVYKDASKRNMDSPAIWAVATFFIGIFGLLLYILVRD